jgi:hypothetical protein
MMRALVITVNCLRIHSGVESVEGDRFVNHASKGLLAQKNDEGERNNLRSVFIILKIMSLVTYVVDNFMKNQES